MNDIRKKLLELDAQIKASLKEIFGTVEDDLHISIFRLTPEQINAIDKKPRLNHVDRGEHGGKVHYFSSGGLDREKRNMTSLKALYNWSFFSQDWTPKKCNECHINCECHSES